MNPPLIPFIILLVCVVPQSCSSPVQPGINHYAVFQPKAGVLSLVQPPKTALIKPKVDVSLALPAATALSKANPPHQSPKADHPAVGVANAIIAAISSDNVEALKGLLNDVNRVKLDAKQLLKLMDEAQHKIGSTTQVTELRTAPRFMAQGTMIAKVRIMKNRVVVFVLTPQDSTYRLEDINGPSLTQYEGLKPVWP